MFGQSDPVNEPMVRALDDPDTRTVVLGERAFLKRLGGSCQVPIAGHGELNHNRFHLTGLVADIDGSCVFKSVLSGAGDRSESVGISLAEKLLSRGADKIMEKLHLMESTNGES